MYNFKYKAGKGLQVDINGEPDDGDYAYDNWKDKQLEEIAERKEEERSDYQEEMIEKGLCDSDFL